MKNIKTIHLWCIWELLFPLLMGGMLACNRRAEELILPLPTQICLQTVHHTIAIPDALVYVKFNTTEYPGLGQDDAFFDTILNTDAAGRVCWNPVPLGKHWIVAKGLDETGSFALPVFGAIQVELTNQRLKIDTTLFVTE
jgi:hypothetical protein